MNITIINSIINEKTKKKKMKTTTNNLVMVRLTETVLENIPSLESTTQMVAETRVTAQSICAKLMSDTQNRYICTKSSQHTG